VANDIDIVVGVKDLATSVLDRLAAKVNSMGGMAKDAFAGAAERLNDQLAKAANGSGGNERIAKAIETAANGLSVKIEAAVARTNSSIDSLTGKIQGAVNSLASIAIKAASIASVGAAFVTVGRGVFGAAGMLSDFVLGANKAEASTQKLRVGVLSSLAPFSRYVVAAGATVALTDATLKATSATSSLLTRVTAVGRGALAAFVLRNALKKTEDGASTLGAKLARVAGFALALDVVARASFRFGLSLLGIGNNANVATNALSKTVNVAARITSAPMKAFASGASAAAISTTHLASSIEDLPRGAQSVNALVSGFGNFAAQIGGIPGLLFAIPAGIAGLAVAAVTAANKTERQITQLTNKLAMVEAARLNVSIEEIDTAPLRKVAEDTAKIAKQIQTATNVQSSSLVSLATSSLPKGLDASQLGDAMKSAVGLSEVYGTSIEEGMYRTRQALEGNFEAFEKLIPSIATMATSEEKLAAVSKLAANGFKVAQQETMTFWGSIEKAKNGIGNVLESIGQMESGTNILGTVLRDVLAPILEGLDGTFQRFGFSGRDAIELVTSGLAGVIAIADTVANNWSTVIDRMLTSVELFAEQTKQSIYNAFNVVVSDYLPWMGRNIVTGFTEAARMAGLVFQGMATRAMDSVGAIADFVASGGAGGLGKITSDLAAINSAPIAGDFTMHLEKLPDVADRALSDTEKLLLDRIKDMDTKLGEDFSKSFTSAYDEMAGMLRDQGLVANIDLKPKMGDVPLAVDAIDKKTKADTATNQVLQSRFLARGASNDPQKEMANTLRRQEALLQKQLAILEKNPRMQSAKLEVEVIT
jgi:hypothetical protein